MTVIVDFCRNVVDCAETQFAIKLAAYELIENLIKYASCDQVMVRIEVVNAKEGPQLLLTTENRATPDRLADATARLAAAEAATDPIVHFDELIQESLQTPNESRLGLGRLRAEADLQLSHVVENDRLTVVVRRAVHRHAEDGRRNSNAPCA